MRAFILLIALLIPVLGTTATLVPSDWDTPAKGYPVEDPAKNPEKKFMPPIVSQDSLGICYAAAASTILNFEQCKRLNVVDCMKVPDSKRISMLGVTRYTRLPKDENDSLDKNYRELPEGGNGSTVLSTAINLVDRVPSEQCASLERVLSKDTIKSKGDLTDAQRAVWDGLKSDYEKYREAVAKNCKDCADKYYQAAVQTVSKNLKIEEDQLVDPNLRNDNLKVLNAFKKETYEEALNALLYPSACSENQNTIELAGKDSLEHNVYPQGESPSREQVLNKIVSILESRQPVLVEPICVADCDKKPNKDKPEDGPKYHAVVVAGYRKICKKNNPTSCRYALKVVNSGGAGWQKANNDGWMEATPLLKNVKMDEAAVSWIGSRMN
ncbi:hypothetical protein ACLVWU_00385 [Bdellovibrio sp. HCB290]|uniref:hypothetical protein n=1 Tax=Bdellovibrio sp. HCB290 TaxID=3394356 RepID=UPI0039B62716